MIELADRKTILTLNPVFGTFILGVQNALHNPLNRTGINLDDIYKDENKSILNALDDWEKESLVDFEERRDKVVLNKKISYQGNLILTLKESSLENYPYLLSESFEELVDKMCWEKVCFLMDYSTPWLSQENDYPPVYEALAFLRKIGVETEFCGGFIADKVSSSALISNLFWLVRCNASLPEIYFTGIDSKTIFSICQYGNLHLEFYDKEEMQFIKAFASQLGFQQEVNRCSEKFSDSEEIIGREIPV